MKNCTSERQDMRYLLTKWWRWISLFVCL